MACCFGGSVYGEAMTEPEREGFYETDCLDGVKWFRLYFDWSQACMPYSIYARDSLSIILT